jgi:hypothetical protein
LSDDEDKEQAVASLSHHGDPARTETLLAWALGQERKAKEQLLRTLAREPN